MALSADKPRIYGDTPLRETAQPVQASTTIYTGGALSRDSGGEVGPIAASETFVGFARKGVNNASGSAGDEDVVVYSSGRIQLTITGLNDNDDIGDTVYASDDDTFTLVASGSVAIGKIDEIISLTAGKAWVYFEGDVRRSI